MNYSIRVFSHGKMLYKEDFHKVSFVPCDSGLITRVDCGAYNDLGMPMIGTGIKDAGGKEIYEGDICIGNIYEGKYKGFIEYADGAFWWVNNFDMIGNTKGFRMLMFGRLGNSEAKLKILGNILENPMILTEMSEKE